MQSSTSYDIRTVQHNTNASVDESAVPAMVGRGVQDSTAGNLDESTVSGRREPPESSGRYFSNPGGLQNSVAGTSRNHETYRNEHRNQDTKTEKPKYNLRPRRR